MRIRHCFSLVGTALLTLAAGASLVAAQAPAAEKSAPVAKLKASVLPFIVDDYPAALAQARAKKLPLFVDAWATWCHTCRSMKAFVFTDAALEEQAGQFVWLEVDADNAKNAPFLKKFPVRAYPTYFVIEPEHEQVILRWLGGVTVPQFQRRLADARTNVERARAASPAAGRVAAAGLGRGARSTATPPLSAATPPPNADDLLARADLLYGEGKAKEAADAYQRALTAAPSDWSSYGRAVEALLIDLSMEHDCPQALRVARDAHARLAKTTSVAVVAGVGLDCALELPDADATKKNAVAFFQDAASKAVADTSIPMAADDRSGLYISLLQAHEATDDAAGAKKVAADWSAFLDAAAASAATPEGRTVFDPHRLNAYLKLEQPEKAVPMLQQSEKDFPDDYNPPARLAMAYKAMKRWDDALAASDRAIARGYGPRLLTLLRARADILVAKGDVAGARKTLEEAVEKSKALPEGQRSEQRTEELRKKLESLSETKPPTPGGG